MRGKKVKTIRPAVEQFAKESNLSFLQTWRQVKKVPVHEWMKANVPKNPKPSSKKMHKGEGLQAFRERRKACNKRRRQRENAIRYVGFLKDEERRLAV